MIQASAFVAMHKKRLFVLIGQFVYNLKRLCTYPTGAGQMA
jgi:hypothetical protein